MLVTKSVQSHPPLASWEDIDNRNNERSVQISWPNSQLKFSNVSLVSHSPSPPPIPPKDSIWNSAYRSESSHKELTGFGNQPHTRKIDLLQSSTQTDRVDRMLGVPHPYREEHLRDSKDNLLTKFKTRMQSLKSISITDIKELYRPVHKKSSNEEFGAKPPSKYVKTHSRHKTEPLINKYSISAPIVERDDSRESQDYRAEEDVYYNKPTTASRPDTKFHRNMNKSKVGRGLRSAFSESTPNLHLFNNDRQQSKQTKKQEEKIGPEEVIRLQREEALRACGLFGTSAGYIGRSSIDTGLESRKMSTAEMIKQDWLKKNTTRR